MKILLQLCLSIMTLLLSTQVLADEYTSSSFKVKDPDINVGGQTEGTSSSFKGKSSIGQPVTGQSASTSYIVRSGFQYYDEATSSTGDVTFTGFGAPNSIVVIQNGGTIVGTTTILSDGSWTKTITFASGTHGVGLFQEDGAGRRSSTVSFNITVSPGSSQTFSNIYFSPTIATSVPSVQQGATINIFGSAQPNVTVKVTVNSHTINVDTTSDGNGTYNLPFNTGTYNLELGLHTTFDKATNGTLQSDISQVLSFTVTAACSGSDLNKDGKVNLTDFSILLYNWGQSPPPNPCADINKDGLVNLTDFSIMLFAWTG